MITSANTVVVPTRLNARKGFDLIAYAGADGTELWQFHTDYIDPPQARSWWPPPLPATLRDDTHAVVAGGRRHGPDPAACQPGPRRRRTPGRVLRPRPAGGRTARPTGRTCFVTTPMTTGARRRRCTSGSRRPRPLLVGLRNGIARISPSGRGSWVPARALAGTIDGAHVALNCAPALSNDGTTAYVALNSHKRLRPVLVGFDSPT